MHAKVENNQVTQYPIDNLRSLFPEISLPANLTIDSNLPSGYVYVVRVSQPACAWDENAIEGTPAYSDGSWRQTWVVSQASTEEQQSRSASKATEVRANRNLLLTQSDWTQLADSPANKEAWATYRQMLRDISSQVEFPWSVVWPEAPQ
jgi:hypothetical protein